MSYDVPTSMDSALQRQPSALDMSGITKRFGRVVACNDVDFDVRAGEIHGLLGQNGAGKSTLMKVLTGLLTPDAGVIRVRGEAVVIADPLVAARIGIGMVHQHFSLVEALTVWENIALGDKQRIDKARSIRETEVVSARYGLDVDPHSRVRDLSAGQRQRVEILKCLRRDPAFLILDEPTSVLTLQESAELFRILRSSVVEEGRAVVLISHKLDEIMAATDRVTIMRDGSVVARMSTADADVETLAREMVGRPVALRTVAGLLGLAGIAEETALARSAAEPTHNQPAVVEVDRATVIGPEGRRSLDGFTLTVRGGEILGLAGVEGNGQAALADVFNSLVALHGGEVRIDGRAIRTGRPGVMVRAGICVVPADRHAAGCVLDMSVAENLVLDHLETVSHGHRLSRRAMRENALALMDEYDVRADSPDALMRSLSGGNQQRVVLARVLSRAPRLLVADQPSHGLDVGAVAYVAQKLRDAARAGAAVLLISSELDELLALSDRVAVIYRGRNMGVLERHELDMEQIGLMMGGRAR
jgi:simple sugar transport system ATP-binding protein